jgi:hypothetical protein
VGMGASCTWPPWEGQAPAIRQAAFACKPYRQWRQGLWRAGLGMRAMHRRMPAMSLPNHPRLASSRAMPAAAHRAARMVAARPARSAVSWPARRPKTALP